MIRAVSTPELEISAKRLHARNRSRVSSSSNSRRVSVRTDFEVVDDSGPSQSTNAVKRWSLTRKRRAKTPEMRRSRPTSSTSFKSEQFEPRTTKSALLRQKIAIEQKRAADAPKEKSPKIKRPSPAPRHRSLDKSQATSPRPAASGQPFEGTKNGGRGQAFPRSLDQPHTSMKPDWRNAPIDKSALKLDFRGLHEDDDAHRATQYVPANPPLESASPAEAIASSTRGSVSSVQEPRADQVDAPRSPTAALANADLATGFQAHGPVVAPDHDRPLEKMDDVARAAGGRDEVEEVNPVTSPANEARTSPVIDKPAAATPSRKLAQYSKGSRSSKEEDHNESYPSDHLLTENVETKPPTPLSATGSAASSKKLASYRRSRLQTREGESGEAKVTQPQPRARPTSQERPLVEKKDRGSPPVREHIGNGRSVESGQRHTAPGDHEGGNEDVPAYRDDFENTTLPKADHSGRPKASNGARHKEPSAIQLEGTPPKNDQDTHAMELGEGGDIPDGLGKSQSGNGHDLKNGGNKFEGALGTRNPEEKFVGRGIQAMPITTGQGKKHGGELGEIASRGESHANGKPDQAQKAKPAVREAGKNIQEVPKSATGNGRPIESVAESHEALDQTTGPVKESPKALGPAETPGNARRAATGHETGSKDVSGHPSVPVDHSITTAPGGIAFVSSSKPESVQSAHSAKSTHHEHDHGSSSLPKNVVGQIDPKATSPSARREAKSLKEQVPLTSEDVEAQSAKAPEMAKANGQHRSTPASVHSTERGSRAKDKENGQKTARSVVDDAPALTPEKLDTIRRYLEEQAHVDQDRMSDVHEAIVLQQSNRSEKKRALDPVYHLTLVVERITDEKRQLTELCSQLLQQMQLTTTKLIEIEARQEQSLLAFLPKDSYWKAEENQQSHNRVTQAKQNELVKPEGHCERCQEQEKLHEQRIQQLRVEHEETLNALKSNYEAQIAELNIAISSHKPTVKPQTEDNSTQTEDVSESDPQRHSDESLPAPEQIPLEQTTIKQETARSEKGRETKEAPEPKAEEKARRAGVTEGSGNGIAVDTQEMNNSTTTSGQDFSVRLQDLQQENNNLKKQLEDLQHRCDALTKLIKLG